MKIMYNVNEIVSRMNSGESLENIATELTTVLNEAKKVYDEELKAKALAQKAEYKREDMAGILQDILAWLKEYYPDFCNEVAKDLGDADKDELFETVLDAILESMDKTAKMATSPASMFGMSPLMMAMMMDQPIRKPKTVNVKFNKPETKTEDDVLNDFLKSICH
jgi:hypothetical protein